MNAESAARWFMATIVVELLYMLIRQAPQYWWVIGGLFFWACCICSRKSRRLCFFRSFTKFEPLENEELKRA